MPKVTKQGSEKPLMVEITQVRNGFKVCGYVNGESTDHEYVYIKLDDALKEVKGMFSVLKKEMPKETKDDLESERERINKEEDY